jgi:hypothetical protein
MQVLIYSFLIERVSPFVLRTKRRLEVDCFLQVYVVWPHTGTRLSSKAYCLCLIMMLGYCVVAVLMIVGGALHYFFLDNLTYSHS